MFEIIHIEIFISLCFSSLFFQAMFDYSKPVVNYESGHQLDNSRSWNQCQTTRPGQPAHSSLMGRTSMHFWKKDDKDVSFQDESLEIVAILSNNCPNCPVGASLRFFRVDWHSFRWEPNFGNTGCSPMMIGADLSPKISASVYLQHHSLILPSCVCVCGCHISISYIPMGLGCSIHWYFSDWIPIFLVYEDPCSLVIHRSSPRFMVSTSPVSLRSLIAWRPGCSTNAPLCKNYVARWTLVVLWRYLNWWKEEHPGIIMNLYASNISKSPERKSQQVTSPITWPPEYHVFFNARSVENHRERLICGICLSQRS